MFLRIIYDVALLAIGFSIITLIYLKKYRSDISICRKNIDHLKAIFGEVIKACGYTSYKIIPLPYGSIPNACAAIPYIITVNTYWGVILLNQYESNSIVKDAFTETISHEITHKHAKPYKPHFRTRDFKNHKKFSCWVNEVFADYGGAKIALSYNTKRISDVFDYKLQENKRLIKNFIDKDENDHPSLNKRKKYIIDNNHQLRSFNKELLDEIAEDIGMNDNDFVNETLDYYVSLPFYKIINEGT